MKCSVCTSENWHHTDFHSQSLIQACKECGAFWHKIEPEEEAKIRDYYRKDYRKIKIPTHENIITTNNKKGYVGLFLRDFLKDKKNLVVGDVGAATGYLCRWFTDLGHKAYGSEWTLMYRRFSEHFYGIPLAEDLDTKHKYDLIVMYHTFEHMIEPDKKLAHYASLLKDDGHMMISTPEWFHIMEEPSSSRWVSFENFYHKDHINIFSRQTLQNMFRNAGLEIVKEDYIQYGQTYLVKKGKAQPIIKENWEEKIKLMSLQKQAADCYSKKEFEKAVEYFYLFTDAHFEIIGNIFGKDRDKQAELFDELIKKFPQNKRVLLSHATWLYQGQEFEKALPIFQELLNTTPASDIFVYTGWCFAMLKRHKEAIQHFHWASQQNPMKWGEMFTEISKEACEMPTWDEVAVETLKEELLKSHMEKTGVGVS